MQFWASAKAPSSAAGAARILKAVIPAGFALLLVQSLAALLRAFVSLVTGQPIRRPGQDEHGVEHAA